MKQLNLKSLYESLSHEAHVCKPPQYVISVCMHLIFRDNVLIAKALENYSHKWKKHEANFTKFR